MHKSQGYCLGTKGAEWASVYCVSIFCVFMWNLGIIVVTWVEANRDPKTQISNSSVPFKGRKKKINVQSVNLLEKLIVILASQ